MAAGPCNSNSADDFAPRQLQAVPATVSKHRHHEPATINNYYTQRRTSNHSTCTTTTHPVKQYATARCNNKPPSNRSNRLRQAPQL